MQADVNAGNAQAVGDWITKGYIEIVSTSAQTKSVTFTADRTAEYNIMSYMHYRGGTNSGGTRSYGVVVNWYKIERGEDATAWMPGADDQLLWKNYILNPRAIDANIDDDYCTEEVDQHADPIFGEFVQVDHDTAQNWQITFTAGNNYSALVGKVTTWFVICRCVNGYEVQEGNNRKRLCFGGGDENVSAVDTATAAFTDLGNGWRKYYATRQIATGLMANNSGVDTHTIGINCVQGRWDVWAVGVVMGGVCPSVQEIMERCGQLATGIDITNEKIVITTNKFVVQTNSGQKTLVASNGYINMSLLNVQQIWADVVTAKNGIFDDITIKGFMYKAKLTINASNVAAYTITTDFGVYLDVLKCGQFVEIASNVGQRIDVAMPYMDSYTATKYNEQQKDECRMLIGNTLLVVNRSSYTMSFTGALKETESGSSVSFGIGQNSFCYMECKCKITDGYEEIYWLYKQGSIR